MEAEVQAAKEAGSGVAHGGGCGSDYLVRLGMEPLSAVDVKSLDSW